MKKLILLLGIIGVLSGAVNAQSKFPSKNSPVNFSFLMGWDGLGTSPMSGMQTMDDNAYSTRPWFNSWQMELTYNFVNLGDLRVFGGVGYESDVFLMDYDYVYLARMDADGNVLPKALMCVADDDVKDAYGMTHDGWETRLVARYITIPVGISYDFSNSFGLGLTLLPGLNYTSRYTGMKYSNYGEDIYSMRDDLGRFMRTYKMDVRFNVSFSFFSVFMQMSTLPIFRNTDRNDIYPMRLGFMFKF